MLKVPQWVPPRVQDIILHIHPKSDEEVKDDGTTHREKGDIDEILPDRGSGNAHPLADGAAYPEHVPFDKVFEALHSTKVEKN
jgi:hypothetical protein